MYKSEWKSILLQGNDQNFHVDPEGQPPPRSLICWITKQKAVELGIKSEPK